jgi:hypothetical protein
VLVLQNLIDKPVLDSDSSRASTVQVADELLKERRRAERVVGQNVQQLLRPGLQAGGGETLGVFLGTRQAT